MDERDVDEDGAELLHALDAVVQVDPALGRLGPARRARGRLADGDEGIDGRGEREARDAREELEAPPGATLALCLLDLVRNAHLERGVVEGEREKASRERWVDDERDRGRHWLWSARAVL